MLQVLNKVSAVTRQAVLCDTGREGSISWLAMLEWCGCDTGRRQRGEWGGGRREKEKGGKEGWRREVYKLAGNVGAFGVAVILVRMLKGMVWL